LEFFFEWGACTTMASSNHWRRTESEEAIIIRCIVNFVILVTPSSLMTSLHRSPKTPKARHGPIILLRGLMVARWLVGWVERWKLHCFQTEM